jgi:hypothetical protein
MIGQLCFGAERPEFKPGEMEEIIKSKSRPFPTEEGDAARFSRELDVNRAHIYRYFFAMYQPMGYTGGSHGIITFGNPYKVLQGEIPEDKNSLEYSIYLNNISQFQSQHLGNLEKQFRLEAFSQKMVRTEKGTVAKTPVRFHSEFVALLGVKVDENFETVQSYVLAKLAELKKENFCNDQIIQRRLIELNITDLENEKNKQFFCESEKKKLSAEQTQEYKPRILTELNKTNIFRRPH